MAYQGAGAQAGRARRITAEFPTGRDPASVRRRIEAIERVMERAFTIPGTKVPVGLDSFTGLVPVAGDLVGAVIGIWLVWEARNLGMSRLQLARMMANVGVDAALGAVPLAGDVFDFFYRSNSRNLRIVRKHLDRHHPATRIIEG